MIRILKSLLIVLMVFAMFIATAYAVDKEHSEIGFLTDYSLLKKGADPLKQVEWFYQNDKIDIKSYDKIIFELPTFFIDNDAEYKGIDPKELSALSDAISRSVVTVLSEFFSFTDDPGPGVLIYRIGITELVPTKPGVATMTTILPIGLGLSILEKAKTGSHMGIGRITSQRELIDSQTGEIVGAIIDTTMGEKFKLVQNLEKWKFAVAAFQDWMNGFRERLEYEISGKK